MRQALDDLLRRLLKEADTASYQALIHKTLSFKIIPGPALKLHFDQDGIIWNSDHPVDLAIEGPLNAFLIYLNAEDRLRAQAAGLKLHGDLSIAAHLQRLRGRVNLHNEDLWALFTPESLARPLSRLIKRAQDTLGQSHQRLSETLSDYLRFESDYLPDELAYQDFIQAVDELKLAVDRAHCRIDILQRGAHS